MLQSLSVLALRNLAEGACKAVEMEILTQGTDAAVGFLAQHFTDQSRRLTDALHRANDRAWKALEIALAGSSWWERCSVRLAAGEQKAVRQQLQAFLDVTPLAGLPSHGPEFRQECLRQLRAARKAGFLTAGKLEPRELAQQAGAFARFSDPQTVLQTESQALEQMADELRQAGYGGLAHLVSLRPDQGPPLLVTAARYFFRREVEADRELFQGLTFAQLENLSQHQEAGFAALGDALAEHGRRLEELLQDVQTVVVETHAGVLDVKAELERQRRQLQELGQAVLQALAQQNLDRRELRAGDSLSLRTEGERQLVKQLVGRYRSLPEEERRRMPALLNAIGKLEVLAGDFDAAGHDFRAVAELVTDPDARAEAAYNAYQAALERREWTVALSALQRAAQLYPARFEPFPLSKYEPLRILGAGGFGVAFLCRHRNSGSALVIKTLRSDHLNRDTSQVFAEARVLEELAHPAIIRLRDCDYADPSHKARPYLVMDYFEAPTLEDHVRRHGPLSPPELLALARPVAEGLRAAHEQAILHRDVKPANLLVRRDPEGWQVKLIDFGLALPQEALRDTVRGSGSRSVVGSSLAGTVDYAAPEQMGRLPGVAPGPQSDLYGFGKTCCFALFQTPQPTWQHWQKVPPPLAEFLGECLAESPEQRPADFSVVASRLARLSAKPTGAVEPVVLEAQPVPAARSDRRSRRVPSAKQVARERPRRSVWPWVLGLLFASVLVLCVGLPFWGLNRLFNGRVGFPAREEPKPLSVEELPQALADLKSTDTSRRRTAAQRLSVTDPTIVKEPSADLAPVLEGLLRDPDGPTRVAAAGALGPWGSRKNVEALVRVVNDPDGNLREAAMNSLACFKDERAAAAVAARLTDGWDRSRAGKALKAMGSLAEDAVLKYVPEGNDHWTRREACQVLQVIGTRKSIPTLEKAAADKDAFVAADAKAALNIVKTLQPNP
jgi:serine/threonine protein kinase